MHPFPRWFVAAAAAAAMAFAASVAMASPVAYGVLINTSALVAQGTFTLDLQLTDGSGGGDGNNSLSLNSFSFGGGSAAATVLTGGATGSLAAGFTLADSVFFSGIQQDFTAGSTLSFNVILNSNLPDAGVTPDLFTVAILDSSFSELPTNGVANEFISITLDGKPTIAAFGSKHGAPYVIDAPSVTPLSGSVPEPSALWLAGGALFALYTSRTSARRAAA